MLIINYLIANNSADFPLLTQNNSGSTWEKNWLMKYVWRSIVNVQTQTLHPPIN